MRFSETPIAIYSSVIIHENTGVEIQDTHRLIGLLRIPVAHFKRAVGPFALGHHRLATAVLCVRGEIIGLCAVFLFHDSHVGCKEYVIHTALVELFAVGSFV